MHKFVRQLITEWRRLGLPVGGEVVVIGVSGGADSSALVAALAELTKRKKLEIDIVAAHFNHKLRGGESDADEAFVRNLAGRLGVRFLAGRGKLAGKSDLEQRAREARYEFLRRIAAKEGALLVLTAHTVNDQAETFLINLIRGSGPQGLVAMRPVRTLSAGKKKESAIRDPRSAVLLARPLLRWATRADTEGFCNEVGIKYRRDAMNDNPRFTRVRVRKEILPKMAELNPKIVETLARTAELLSAAETSWLPNLGERALPETLHLKDLRDLPQNELYETVRIWLRNRRGNLRGVTMKHVEAIGALVHGQKSGRIAELPRSGRVVKAGGRLRFETDKG